jgi:hypothetical protein
MHPRSLLPLLLLLATLTTHAQAPIERRPPTRPLARWPGPTDIPANTHLLIETFDGTHHDLCILSSLDTYRLICAGPRHRPSAIYPRELIASIGLVSRHYIPDHIAAATAETGLATTGLGLLCGVDGGPPCKTPSIIGLSLLATGATLAIVQHHQRTHPQQMLYVAAYPQPANP